MHILNIYSLFTIIAVQDRRLSTWKWVLTLDSPGLVNDVARCAGRRYGTPAVSSGTSLGEGTQLQSESIVKIVVLGGTGTVRRLIYELYYFYLWAYVHSSWKWWFRPEVGPLVPNHSETVKPSSLVRCYIYFRINYHSIFA